MNAALELVNDTLARFKSPSLDPVTLQWMGPGDDERHWKVISLDGKSIYEASDWLLIRNINDWYWMDRAPDSVVHRYNIYFKNEEDLMFFKLGFL